MSNEPEIIVLADDFVEGAPSEEAIKSEAPRSELLESAMRRYDVQPTEDS